MSDLSRQQTIAIIMNRAPPSDPWKVGDLAVCVNEHWRNPSPWDPRKEELLRVSCVCFDGRVLEFEGRPASRGWWQGCFRKVRPDTEPAVDAEWVEQLEHFRRTVPA